MCSDHNVHRTVFQSADDLLLLGRCTEPGHHLNGHRIISHPFQKRCEMLLCQDRSRNQICHLLAILHRLERRPDRNLGFTVSDIPADQPIHDTMTLHVLLRLGDRPQLIIGLFIRKCFLKLFLPYGIRRICKAFLLLPYRIEVHQFFRNACHMSFYPGLRRLPCRTAQLIDLRSGPILAGIFLDQIQLGCQNI